MDIATAQQAGDIVEEIDQLTAEIAAYDAAIADNARIVLIALGNAQGKNQTPVMNRPLGASFSATILGELKSRSETRLANLQTQLGAL